MEKEPSMDEKRIKDESWDVGKHTFVVEPMNMDMQLSLDRYSKACEQKQAKQTSDLSQIWGGIVKAMRGKVKESMENACECCWNEVQIKDK